MKLEDIKRALILGDSHANRKFIEKAISEAVDNDCDAIIQVGDFGYWKKCHHKMHKPYRLPVFFIEGNHDQLDFLVTLNKVTEIVKNLYYIPRNTNVKIGNINTLFIGGGRSIDGTMERLNFDWFPDLEVMNDEEVKYALETPRAQMIISHDCPFSVPIVKNYWQYPATILNRENLQLILEKHNPDLWYFGHYHIPLKKYSYDTDTLFRCLDCHRFEQKVQAIVFDFITQKEVEVYV